VSDILLSFHTLQVENKEAKEGVVASGSTWANMHGLSKSDNLKGLQTYCILLIKLLESK
jgi:hypothetical protein